MAQVVRTSVRAPENGRAGTGEVGPAELPATLAGSAASTLSTQEFPVPP